MEWGGKDKELEMRDGARERERSSKTFLII